MRINARLDIYKYIGRRHISWSVMSSSSKRARGEAGQDERVTKRRKLDHQTADKVRFPSVLLMHIENICRGRRQSRRVETGSGSKKRRWKRPKKCRTWLRCCTQRTRRNTGGTWMRWTRKQRYWSVSRRMTVSGSKWRTSSNAAIHWLWTVSFAFGTKDPTPVAWTVCEAPVNAPGADRLPRVKPLPWCDINSMS